MRVGVHIHTQLVTVCDCVPMCAVVICANNTYVSVCMRLCVTDHTYVSTCMCVGSTCVHVYESRLCLCSVFLWIFFLF